MRTVFFVLSSGRSGSRTIARALNGYGNCTCLHHPEPELIRESTRYFYGELPGDEIAAILRQTRPVEGDKPIYGEVNLQHTLTLPVIRSVFPAAKLVWLIRDGRDVVASMYYRGWFNPPEHKRVPQCWHDARLQGDRTGDFEAGEWRHLDRFAKCCWLWAKYNQLIRDGLAELDPNQWQQVRLDQLKASLPRLEQWLGLRGRRRVLVERHNIAKQPVDYWENWPHEFRRMFDQYAGAEMDRLFPEWRDDGGRWRVIPTEPPDRRPLWLDGADWIAAQAQRGRSLAGKVKRSFVLRGTCGRDGSTSH